MSNPLLESHRLPPFDRIRPEHVVPALDTILAENRATIAALGKLPAAAGLGWQAVPAVLEKLQDRIDQFWAPVSHMNKVMNSEAWRAAYNAILPRMAEYSTELGQNEDLFRFYEALEKSPGFEALGLAQQKTVRNALRDFRLSGIGLAPEKKKRFVEIAQRLAELASSFSDNVLDATQAWDKLLPDAGRLRGLPDSALGLLAALAQQKEQSGYRITLDFPSYIAVMMHAEDRALREEVYTAFVTRASDQGPQAGRFDNSANIDEILRLRLEQARLLGYANYAEVSLVPKMARTPADVMDFLTDLSTRTRPGAERELAELRDFARGELGIADLQAWDVTFASERLKQKKYAISRKGCGPIFRRRA